MSKKPTIGIIGLGPVGSILAAHLVTSGVDVVVEDVAQEILARIRRDGLSILGIRTLSARVRARRTVASLADLVQFKPDIFFLATKACSLQVILDELKPLHKDGMKIVSFQNGLDSERLIAEALEGTAYRVVINYAGELLGPGRVRMNWFQPPNYVGAFKDGRYTTDETTENIANMMTASGLETQEVSDIKRYVWEKTILNSALCSVCALTRQTMKGAMDSTSSRDLAVKVLMEGLEVAKADGYDFGKDAVDRFTAYLEKGGEHKPSMLVDVENRRRTEVDFLSGAILNYGRSHEVETPVNLVLTGLLKALEHKYLTNED